MPYEILVAFLVGLAVIAIGSAVLVVRASRRRALQDRLQGAVVEEQEKVKLSPRRQALAMLEHLSQYVAPHGASSQLEQELAKAGYFGRRAPAIYLGAKPVLLVIGTFSIAVAVAGLPVALSMKILWVLMGGALLSFLPNIFVRIQRDKRRAEVERHLADAVDLLEICVSSGMGMDMAWNSVAEEIRSVSAVVADEMSLTSLQMHLGAPRADAMRQMAERTGAEDIASLVAVLVQTERFGTGLAEALRSFAGSVREMKSQRASEAAEKMAVKLLFPLVVFIFPTILIVTAGPAGIKIADIFSGG